jgi:hypothetical protein
VRTHHDVVRKGHTVHAGIVSHAREVHELPAIKVGKIVPEIRQ